MHKLMTIILAVAICELALYPLVSAAQPADANGPPSNDRNSSIVTKMMAFDKNHDGKLTRDELTDERLLRLFDRADANGDGVVTKTELTALAAKLDAENSQRGDTGGPGGPEGPGGSNEANGPGPGGGGGRFGAGGRGGRMGGGPPPLGQILPPFVQNALKLTADQKKQVADLQAEVDSKLHNILTDEQNKEFASMRARGPGRGAGGPPGGRGPASRPADGPE